MQMSKRSNKERISLPSPVDKLIRDNEGSLDTKFEKKKKIREKLM